MTIRQSKEVHYKLLGDNDDVVSIKYESSKTNKQLEYLLFFGKDSTDVALRVFSIVTFPDDMLAKAYKACSDLNAKFRWVKFYIDKDNELTAQIDAVIEPNTCAEECIELLVRTMSIMDDAYPFIMKLLWDGSGVSAPEKK